MVEPVLLSGARPRFYNVPLTLHADAKAIRQDTTPRTRVLVVVHHFGFPQPLTEILELCAEAGITLIEDCSHALFSEAQGQPLGSSAALALFSLRKTLPVFDGALLVANDLAVRLPDVRRRPGWNYTARALRWALRSLRGGEPWTPEPEEAIPDRLPEHAPRERQESLSLYGWLRGNEVNPALHGTTGTALTRISARRFAARTIREARRRNYQRLLERLRGLETIRVPFDDIPEGICPWTFPIDIRGRPGFDRRLRQSGVPAFTYGNILHAELPGGAYPDCEYLALNLIQIPVHQGLSLDDMDRMASAIHEAGSRR